MAFDRSSLVVAPSVARQFSQVSPIHDEHDNGILARTYPLFLFATVFILMLAVLV